MMNKDFDLRKHHSLLYFILICILLYGIQILYHTQTKVQEEDTIAIFGFHNVVRDEEKEEYYKYNMWVDSESSFREKLQYLYDQGYQTWTLDDLYEWKQGNLSKPEHVVILTFDDGYYASSYLIAPILKEYGFQATTFVVGSMIEGEHSWDASRLQYLNMSDMQDQSTMNYASHTFAMHGKTQGNFILDLKTKTEMQEDMDKQFKITDLSYIAYPYGYYNDQMIEVLRENHVKLAFGYNENRKASIHDHNYKLPRFAVTAFTTMDSFRAMLESER